MTSWREFRGALAFVLAAVLACPPAHGLVSLNDGHDKIHLNASTSFGYDSNVFANSADRSSAVYSTSLQAEYTRRAGWIGVNGNMGVTSSKFGNVAGEDFANPSFGLEFTKQTGRTTGAFTVNASRESRADADVNTRSTYWLVPVGLNFKYPIVSTYTMAGSFGYSSQRYVNETVFASLATYNASFDLFHPLGSERDIFAGYRYRYSDTTHETSSIDHAWSLGLNGKLIRGVNGNLRLGYQTRILDTLLGSQSLGSWTASGTATYSLNKKLSLTGTIAKDFATTATDASVDSLTTSLDLQYTYSSHWSATGSASYGNNAFLGQGGRVDYIRGGPPPVGPNRHDHFLTTSASLNYSLNEHFKAGLTYSWFRNSSNVSIADFVRSSWTLSLSTRW